MTKPKPGDKILIFKEPWLSMILGGRKKMDIRGAALAAGRYYLGFKKKIFGVMLTGTPQHISSSHEYQRLRKKHLVRGALPYKRTFALPILQVKVIKPPIKFTHPRGAITVVRFR